MAAPLIASAAAPIVGGMLGNIFSSGDRNRAQELIEQSVRDLEAIGIPSVEAQRLAVEMYESQGNLTPELEDAVKLGDSEMLGVSTDPKFKESQLAALAELEAIADGGGMTLADKANLEKVLGDINADERGAREAILASAREKGQSGSGLELAAQLQNQQDAATRAHQQGLSTAAIAQQRALDAIMQGGELAGGLREQEFGEKSKAAAAQDAIKQWNAANTQDVRQRNVQGQNYAQEYNLGNKQRIADSNVDLRNDEQKYNSGLLQQDYDNRLNRQNSINNARTNQATSLNQSADRTANMWTGMGGGVGQGAAAIGQSNRYDDLMDRVYGPKKVRS